MKEIKSAKKTHFLKKILIKICRIFGYELIDQSSFEFPVSNKRYNEQIGVPGKSSITLGLGVFSTIICTMVISRLLINYFYIQNRERNLKL